MRSKVGKRRVPVSFLDRNANIVGAEWNTSQQPAASNGQERRRGSSAEEKEPPKKEGAHKSGGGHREHSRPGVMFGHDLLVV